MGIAVRGVSIDSGVIPLKVDEALIAWTPWDIDLPTRGRVKVGLLEDINGKDWTELYAHVSAHRSGTKGDASVVSVFRDFQYLVVEERLDAEAVHKEFLKIDEYARMLGAHEGSH
jgi:hypothetical protein